MTERLEQAWSQIGWLLFLSIGVLVIGVGIDTFLNPAGWFISHPFDQSWAKLFAVLLFGAALLALVFKGWLLIVLVGASALALILIPLLRNSSNGALLVAIWIGLAAYLLGDAILIWFGVHSLPKLDRLALALATGFGGLMLISTTLGFVGLYYPVAAWGVLGFISVILLPRKLLVAWRFLRGSWRDLPVQWGDIRLISWGWGVILICGLGAYLWALAPAVRWDSLSYHVPVPLHYIRHHAIAELPESLQSYWAHYAETLYTLGMLIEPFTSLPGLLHYEMGLVTTLFTFVLGRKLGGTTQGILAAVIFWTLPMVQVEAGSAYIDLFTAAFVSALLYTSWTWTALRDDRWLLLSGAFVGMAVGIKLSAAIPVGLVGIFVLYHAIRQHTPTQGVWRQALWFGLPALLIAAPWFVRDWAWTGNPVFPNYNQIFHSPKGFETTFFAFQPAASKLNGISSLPLDLLLRSFGFYHEMPGFALGGLSLLSLPWLYPWISNKHKRPVLATMAGFVLLTIIIAIQASSNFRYLIFIFPLMAVLSSENLLILWRVIKNRQVERLLLLVALGIGTTYLLATQLAIVVGHFLLLERYPYRYAFGLEPADKLLQRVVPSYSAFRFLEKHVQGPVKILSLGNEFRLYTTAQIYGPLFSQEAFDVLHNSSDSETLAKDLKKLGYTHLLLYRPEIEYRPQAYTSPALDKEFLHRYTRPLYVQDQMAIYLLVNDPLDHGQAPANMLVNPSLEALTAQGTPEGWELTGNPDISTNGTQAHSGRVAARITGPSVSGASQMVPVEPEKIYTLSYWANPESEDQILQLHVQWLDEEQEILTQSAEWAHLKSGWNNYQASFSAPTDTAYARLWVTTSTPGTTWVDDLCMTTAAACL